MPRMYCSHVAYCITLNIQTLTTSRLPRDPGSQKWSWTLLLLDVPTFTTSRLPRDSSSQRWNYVGEKWPMNFAWNVRLPRSIQESFTCRKSTTWDRRLYFPSEGRGAEDFFALKNPTALAGFEPANLGAKGQHATSRPPKPLGIVVEEHVAIFPVYLFHNHLITPASAANLKTQFIFMYITLLRGALPYFTVTSTFKPKIIRPYIVYFLLIF